ncbi:hypothetical protein LCGC14_3138850, partial [marine sediment metagenome]
FYTVDGKHHPIPHAGNVVIEDDVSIGACVAVDRAKFGSTRIGTGSKLDNHVQIAHNVQIGTGCILCAHCAIAGSTKLGDYVVFGGNVGANDNIEIGDGVRGAAFAAIAADVAPGQEISGIPAQPIRDHFRQLMALRKLGPKGPIDNELRFPNEHARHKVCDLIGDLALLGRRLCGRIVAYKSGHKLNHALVRKLTETITEQEPSRRLSTGPVMDIR